ncbi:hypothetical protein OGAPHI_005054 [Ogataea philodendri]|uniref:Uncharacterized protein n=1 Tax=Ogataea philodendri TaxID=1378263 RepID=A0A9P8P0M1_9ASCO|nr:uncharacterized protein OGAPHI_005054 [Ogataea philodendri]KAH3663653.1 hypothetical protein OGAPHI_005054 [Ogataea philodendri]
MLAAFGRRGGRSGTKFKSSDLVLFLIGDTGSCSDWLLYGDRSPDLSDHSVDEDFIIGLEIVLNIVEALLEPGWLDIGLVLDFLDADSLRSGSISFSPRSLGTSFSSSMSSSKSMKHSELSLSFGVAKLLTGCPVDGVRWCPVFGVAGTVAGPWNVDFGFGV